MEHAGCNTNVIWKALGRVDQYVNRPIAVPKPCNDRSELATIQREASTNSRVSRGLEILTSSADRFIFRLHSF